MYIYENRLNLTVDTWKGNFEVFCGVRAGVTSQKRVAGVDEAQETSVARMLHDRRRHAATARHFATIRPAHHKHVHVPTSFATFKSADTQRITYTSDGHSSCVEVRPYSALSMLIGPRGHQSLSHRFSRTFTTCCPGIGAGVVAVNHSDDKTIISTSKFSAALLLSMGLDSDSRHV